MLSDRLRQFVYALPLRPGLRVIEIGCGPGAAAIEVAERVGPTGHVPGGRLFIDGGDPLREIHVPEG